MVKERWSLEPSSAAVCWSWWRVVVVVVVACVSGFLPTALPHSLPHSPHHPSTLLSTPSFSYHYQHHSPHRQQQHHTPPPFRSDKPTSLRILSSSSPSSSSSFSSHPLHRRSSSSSSPLAPARVYVPRFLATPRASPTPPQKQDDQPEHPWPLSTHESVWPSTSLKPREFWPAYTMGGTDNDGDNDDDEEEDEEEEEEEEEEEVQEEGFWPLPMVSNFPLIMDYDSWQVPKNLDLLTSPGNADFSRPGSEKSLFSWPLILPLRNPPTPRLLAPRHHHRPRAVPQKEEEEEHPEEEEKVKSKLVAFMLNDDDDMENHRLKKQLGDKKHKRNRNRKIGKVILAQLPRLEDTVDIENEHTERPDETGDTQGKQKAPETGETPPKKGQIKDKIKRAISLWVTLHPLTPVPNHRSSLGRGGRRQVKPHAVKEKGGGRPYGQPLRWGR